VFALVNLSLIKLRKTKPHMDRPFKTPLYPLTPILGFVLSVALLIFPVVLGDGNASDALSSSLGITAIVLASYYLRMAGRFRLQIAIGGISIGTGIALIAASLAGLSGLIQPLLPFIPSYIQILFGIVLLVTGYYNLTAHGKKNNNKNSNNKLSVSGITLEEASG
jgi:amino acid transporter